jgi:hypothetical protein
MSCLKGKPPEFIMATIMDCVIQPCMDYETAGVRVMCMNYYIPDDGARDMYERMAVAYRAAHNCGKCEHWRMDDEGGVPNT